MASRDSSCAFSGDQFENATAESLHLDNVLISNEITTTEYLKMCFKPSYRMRKLKNTGALLVLVLNFLASYAYYYYQLNELAPESFSYCNTCFKIILLVPLAVLVFAGWLADIRLGRYNVLYWSSLMMWLSTVLLLVSLIIVQIVDWHNINYLHLLLLVLLGMSYGGFQANIIQFGIDQLIDASSDEIVAYINWYSWSYVSSGAIEPLVSECTSQRLEILTPFLLCLCLSVLIILLFLYNNVLIKEPVTTNPFRLIHNVLKYASKTKHPRLRSAFTYCEDDRPSRIDFGKSKYGGPFTTEQVEDVKTFFKLLGLVIIAGASFGITNDKIFMQYTLEVYGSRVLNGECWMRYFVTKAYYITIALLIPLNELVIHPLFHRCLPKINCYWKICLGIGIHTARYIVLSVLLTEAHHYDLLTSNLPVANVTIQCIFHDNPVSWISDALDYRLFAIPGIISAVSFTLILVGSIEMLCAQVPYSMKGLVIGIFYGSLGFFLLLSNLIAQLFIWKSYLWRTESVFNCGFWYLQIKLIIHLVVFFIIFLAVTYYKKRKRGDVLPNEQIFAERYYSQ